MTIKKIVVIQCEVDDNPMDHYGGSLIHYETTSGKIFLSVKDAKRQEETDLIDSLWTLLKSETLQASKFDIYQKVAENKAAIRELFNKFTVE